MSGLQDLSALSAIVSERHYSSHGRSEGNDDEEIWVWLIICQALYDQFVNSKFSLVS